MSQKKKFQQNSHFLKPSIPFIPERPVLDRLCHCGLGRRFRRRGLLFAAAIVSEPLLLSPPQHWRVTQGWGVGTDVVGAVFALGSLRPTMELFLYAYEYMYLFYLLNSAKC